MVCRPFQFERLSQHVLAGAPCTEMKFPLRDVAMIVLLLLVKSMPLRKAILLTTNFVTIETFFRKAS